MIYKLKSFSSLIPLQSLFLIFFCACLMSTTSCSTYRVVSGDAPAKTEPKKKTMWTFAWGLVQARDFKVCTGENQSKAIDQIKVKNNLGYALISVLTAGIAMPIQVECHCAKVKVHGGTTGPD